MFTITGSLVHGNIKPSRSVKVELQASDGKVLQTTNSNAWGSYYFENVLPGVYTVKASTSKSSQHLTPEQQTVRVKAGAKATVGDFEIFTSGVEGLVTGM